VERGEIYPPSLAAKPGYGKLLDDNLEALYQWCSAQGVPILTHCSYSQYPSPEAGLRGAPDGWRSVLQRHPDLRLDIGHCGGLWYVPVEASKRPPDPPWTQRTIDILNTPMFSHVAADFADYSTMIEPGADNKTAFDQTMTTVKSWLDPATYSLARSRLMYGTDWSMLAQVHPYDSAYYGAMKSLVPTQLGLSATESAAFIGANAARFLGMCLEGDVKPPTRQRLEAFYKVNHLDPSLLELWDSAVSSTR
jgi:predicted TIM-barrel fold metal-dependent hydrolase